jgi:hypothetical protein
MVDPSLVCAIVEEKAVESAKRNGLTRGCHVADSKTLKKTLHLPAVQFGPWLLSA